MSYDLLPEAGSYQPNRPGRRLATPKLAEHDPQQVAQTTPTAPTAQINPNALTTSIASASKHANVIPRYLADIGDLDDTDAVAAEPKHPKAASKKHQEKDDNESIRMKRIMSICTGC